MVWAQLEVTTPHIAYACVGIFSTLFSLVSLFVKERLYIGEATVASIAGLILGPHCLNWFAPTTWGNSDLITLEICRIVLCIQIVAVSVELPRKYMKKHWLSVAILLLPVMTVGWLVVGLFIWALIPHFSFNDGLLVSACVTATDPVLAAAVVGKGKFAERVPGHLRNLLSAESGCNDGMAFPFIYLSLNLIAHSGHGGEIVKDWILLTILWECVFGCVLGVVIGYVLRKLVEFAESKNLIDRESFLAIFVFIAFNSAGIGSMLGVDDLLVSFAAGTTFGWNGAFAKKTEESHVSTVIDLLLNLSFFVYFGAIIPWPQFNDGTIGLDVWRLIVLSFVIIFLRRLPAVVCLKPFTPDIKTWREAFFCGHFGPIGVGAIFASILARSDLEGYFTEEETPLNEVPGKGFPHDQLLVTIWPLVCFIVITSIIVHGSSVAVLTLGKRLNRMAITMSFTTTNGETGGGGSNWMQRLQKLDRANTSFSLHRVDTMAPDEKEEQEGAQDQSQLPETSGIKVRPAGGAKRRKKKRRNQKQGLIQKTLSRVTSGDEEAQQTRHRPHQEVLQLGGGPQHTPTKSTSSSEPEVTAEVKNSSSSTEGEHLLDPNEKISGRSEYGERSKPETPVPTSAYQEGDKIIIEDQFGEIMDNLTLGKKGAIANKGKNQEGGTSLSGVEEPQQHERDEEREDESIHSAGSLERQLSQYSNGSTIKSQPSESDNEQGPGRKMSPLHKRLSRSASRRTFYRKDDPNKKKVYAHRIDNIITIENEDGEIIRRYKVNRHASTSNATPNRSRSSTLVGKMKSLVGIKPTTTASSQATSAADPTVSSPGVPPQVNVTDLESGTHHNILIPQAERDPHPDSSKLDKIEDKIATILETKHEKGHHSAIRKASPPPPGPTAHDAIEEFDDEDSTEDNEYDDSDEDEETEVEKRRRLQALGKLPTTNRDQNDEE
ncbi:CNH1 [Candida margitis]|uniref:CNH1 n=1 Tax=Candida margitis TaxID=1775924 RepID=UPI0022275F2E|nr:CNH1 [Candida margitis]KAI5952054.1 CNH1 [Candida margitis]